MLLLELPIAKSQMNFQTTPVVEPLVDAGFDGESTREDDLVPPVRCLVGLLVVGLLINVSQGRDEFIMRNKWGGAS